VFDAIDQNRNGTIDGKEFRTACAQLGLGLSDAEADALFETSDRNGDKAIDFREFSILLAKVDEILSSSSQISVRRAARTGGNGRESGAVVEI
jgi:Ca2+-binding EF-hand superfamily protein